MFCGRVFIFLFQSFPLGDKSSVNLRGEFHTENVTTFDDVVKPSPEAEEDTVMADENDNASPTETDAGPGDQPDGPSPIPKVVFSEEKSGMNGQMKGKVDLDALYPVFWSLQAYFSSPSQLFDSERFAAFKSGLEATVAAFKNMKTELENKAGSRSSEEARKSHRRKRVAEDAEVGISFNPKYLTSRDLFDLEVSDTAFRRHVLVQALILIDFMLSLTPKAKSRLVDATNKSVLYGFDMNEEDAKWAADMRKSIEGYLRQGDGGNFYFRMVDTVLSRDKNWVRWKAEGCPPIERPAVSVSDYMSAREHATKAYANKRIRPSPMGSLDLKFLSDSEALANIERLKESDRVTIPSADSLMMGIMDDEMDIDTAQTPDDKALAEKAKSSKTWRLLRLSVKTKLGRFDKFKDGENLNALFETPEAPSETPQPVEGSQPPEEKTVPTLTPSIEAPSGGGGDEVKVEEAREGSGPVTVESATTIADANQLNDVPSEPAPVPETTTVLAEGNSTDSPGPAATTGTAPEKTTEEEPTTAT